ncbi:MAG: hypothetical protein EOM05_10215 [Clostridia bacterium]|nr:hypothetical protein [Clostridia bacterium]
MKKIALVVLALFLSAICIQAQTTICAGESITLSFDNEIAVSQQAQWQFSTDETNWIDITEATYSSFEFTPVLTGFYRLKITDTECETNEYYSDIQHLTINTYPEIDQPENIDVCGSYTLPELTNGNYFLQSGGVESINEGTTLNISDVIYVYAANGDCVSEHSFMVEIQEFCPVVIVLDLDEFVDGGGTIYPTDVKIAGDFNSWSMEVMTQVSDTKFSYTKFYNSEDVGQQVQFKFVTSGAWYGPGDTECGVNDGYGGYNYNLTIPNNSEAHIYEYCLGSCFPCMTK